MEKRENETKKLSKVFKTRQFDRVKLAFNTERTRSLNTKGIFMGVQQ